MKQHRHAAASNRRHIINDTEDDTMTTAVEEHTEATAKLDRAVWVRMPGMQPICWRVLSSTWDDSKALAEDYAEIARRGGGDLAILPRVYVKGVPLATPDEATFNAGMLCWGDTYTPTAGATSLCIGCNNVVATDGGVIVRHTRGGTVL